MAGADADTPGEIFNASILEAALADEAQSTRDGVRGAKPGGRSGRAFGPAAKTGAETGFSSGGSGWEVATVFFLGGRRGADRAAIDPTADDSDEELAVEARVARKAGTRAGLEIESHFAHAAMLNAEIRSAEGSGRPSYAIIVELNAGIGRFRTWVPAIGNETRTSARWKFGHIAIGQFDWNRIVLMSPSSHPSRSNFVRLLPKAELHLHLEGSIEPATLLELRQRHGMQGATLPEVEQLYKFTDFAGFLTAFKDVTGHLRGPADYELIVYRLMEQLRAQNVLHAEVTVSVGVCLWRGQDFPAIFEGLERGRVHGEKEFGVSLLWIFDAIRQFGAEKAQPVLDLAIRYRDRNVVAFGIGGDEAKGPPEMFGEVFARAAENGLHLTAHAGESAGPESIWGALNLKAERIGHGLTAAQDAELIEELAQRQVPIEICVTSNLRTGVCADVSAHPVRRYFDEGLMVTINSDDPAMFGSSLVGEYELVQRHFGFSDEQLRELARNSFESAFLTAEKKVAFLNLFDAAAVR